jgi:hypothetical protein
MPYYILDKDNNLDAIYDWRFQREWFDNNAKRTQIGINHLPDGSMLSTIFLRTSPKIGDDKLLFETCFFGKNEIYEKDHFPINYRTYQEALAGHLEILKTLI